MLVVRDLKMKKLFIILCLIFATSAIAKDVVFESSDGIWTDNTVEMKGRNFRAVLWTFEAYKLKHNKPDVTLVRTTPDPRWNLFRSSKEKSKPEWKVSYSEPSGTAKHPFNSYTEEECREINKRTEASHTYWKNK